MKIGSKVKILDKNSEHFGKIGTLGLQNVECLPICSVYFDDGDFDYFLEDEIEEIGRDELLQAKN